MQEENHFIETTCGWSSDFSLVFLEQGFLYSDFFCHSYSRFLEENHFIEDFILVEVVNFCLSFLWSPL